MSAAASTPPCPTTTPYAVVNADARITDRAFCDHGQLTYLVHLHGHHLDNDHATEHEHLTLVLPRCVAARLIGTLTALVGEREGVLALDHFTDEITEATEAATLRIRKRRN